MAKCLSYSDAAGSTMSGIRLLHGTSFSLLYIHSMRNIFGSGRYLEHYGTMQIKNKAGGHSCQVQFKETGYFATTAKNEVVGNLYGPNGKKVCSLQGNWDNNLAYFNDKSPDTLQVLWRAKAPPPNTAEIYGFSDFALELNGTSSLNMLRNHAGYRRNTTTNRYETAT